MVPGQVVSDFLADQCKKSKHIWSIFPERWRLLLSSRVSRWTREDYHFTKKTEKYIAFIPQVLQLRSEDFPPNTPFSMENEHAFWNSSLNFEISNFILNRKFRWLGVRKESYRLYRIIDLISIQYSHYIWRSNPSTIRRSNRSWTELSKFLAGHKNLFSMAPIFWVGVFKD